MLTLGTDPDVNNSVKSARTLGTHKVVPSDCVYPFHPIKRTPIDEPLFALMNGVNLIRLINSLLDNVSYTTCVAGLVVEAVLTPAPVAYDAGNAVDTLLYPRC